MTLLIEEGHWYLTRGGEIVGPMYRGASAIWPWECPQERENGTSGRTNEGFWNRGGSRADIRDLIQKVDGKKPVRQPSLKDTANESSRSVNAGNTCVDTPTFISDRGPTSAEKEATAPEMRATEIAGRAADLVGGDRDRQHGQKLDNFTRIATMWNAWLQTRKNPASPLTAHDVGIMMAVMKLARTQSGNLNIDDYVDACGYASCAGEVAQTDQN